MKYNKIAKATRLAMGKTQKEMAELIGVSNATISNFESEEKLSGPVYTVIKQGYCSLLNDLSKIDMLKKQILIQAYLLNEDSLSKTEKREISAWVTMYISKYQLELEKYDDYFQNFRV